MDLVDQNDGIDWTGMVEWKGGIGLELGQLMYVLTYHSRCVVTCVLEK